MRKSEYCRYVAIVPIVLLLASAAMADSVAPERYESRIRYSSGTLIQDWTEQCDTENDSALYDMPAFSCTQDIGTEANPTYCAEQGDVEFAWRMYHEPDGGLPYDYTETNYVVAYNIDFDSDPVDCECHDAGIQGDCDNGETYCWETDTSQCCGDDGASDDFCDGAGGFAACYDGTYSTDGDLGSTVCNCGGGNWTADGGTQDCCGDDAGESYCSGTGEYKACYNAVYYIDGDANQFTCECNVSGIWTPLPGQSACLGDDGEEPICESWYPHIWDLNDSCAPCGGLDMCVDDNSCYNDGQFRDVDDTEFGMGVQTGDWEICIGALHEWHDADENQSICDASLNWSGVPLTATGCSGASCWVMEGEDSNFGGYNDSVGQKSVECCGDDQGEYYIKTNIMYACCDDPTDFAHSNGICSRGVSTLGPGLPQENYVYGFVQAELPNGSYSPLENYWISVKYADFITANADFTDSSGYFNISVPAGNYNIYGTKQGYDDVERSVTISGHTNFNFWVNLTNDCKADCTRFDGLEDRCEADCDGVNDCKYDPAIVSATYGDTMKNLCDGLLKGWTVKHNAAWNIECCDVGYVHTVNRTRAEIRFNESISEAQTYFAGTVNYVPSGELYSVYVVIYRKD